MKLRVEHQSTKRIGSFTGGSVEGTARSHVLALTVQRQELSNWCWAAIAASLGDYYRHRHLAQHEIASRLLGYDCSCAASDPEAPIRCMANPCSRSTGFPPSTAVRAVCGGAPFGPGLHRSRNPVQA